MTVRYVAEVDTLLVSGTTVAGLLIGGALDPVGQRLADRSRLEDERRRAERGLPTTEAGSGPGAPPGAGSEDAEARSGNRPACRRRSRPGRLRRPWSPPALFGAAAAHFGRDLVLAPFCVFFAMLVAVSVTDLSHRLGAPPAALRRLALIVPLLVASAAVDHQWHDLTGAVIAGAVAFGLFFAVWWFVPRGMGFGDVRLAGVIGITVGYLSLLHAYVAFLAGFLVGHGLRRGPDGGIVVGPQDPDPLRPVAGRRGGHRRLLGWPDRPRPVPRRIADHGPAPSRFPCMLRFLTAGESHGRALVVIVEGMPAGLLVTAEDIQRGLARRRLGFGRGPADALRGGRGEPPRRDQARSDPRVAGGHRDRQHRMAQVGDRDVPRHPGCPRRS